MDQFVSRRSFVQAAALGAATMGVMGIASAALADEEHAADDKQVLGFVENPEVVPNGEPMRILVLNGSPHSEGNTVALIDAFKEGAEEAGHTVDVVSAYDYLGRISPCRGCGYCMGAGEGSCVQIDAFAEVRELAEQADMIVLASPVHYLNISGALAVLKSRFYAIWCAQRHHVKKIGLILSSNIDRYYGGIAFQVMNDCELIGFEFMGMHTAYGSQNKTPEKLQELRDFGASL